MRQPFALSDREVMILLHRLDPAHMNENYPPLPHRFGVSQARVDQLGSRLLTRLRMEYGRIDRDAAGTPVKGDRPEVGMRVALARLILREHNADLSGCDPDYLTGLSEGIGAFADAGLELDCPCPGEGPMHEPYGPIPADLGSMTDQEMLGIFGL